MRILAEGSYQTSAGQDLYIGMAQQTVSRDFNDVLNAIEKILCPKWITLTMTDEEKNNSKRFFYEKTGFPGVIGAIDGTHIQCIRPHIDEHIYYNRKTKHSINAMVVRENICNIMNIFWKYFLDL